MEVDTDVNKDLRDFRRLQVKLDRDKVRNSVHDGQRIGLGDLNKKVCEKIAESDIKGLAARIKRKKHATKEDLIKLGNGFLDNEENITTFCKITGSINVLVKEFTGKNSDQRLKAAECLCNLSLGNDYCCEKIALLAGTYMMTFIENFMSHGLSVTCLWTLQNLAASGSKPLQVLKSLVIGPKLVHILKDCVNDEIRSECFLLLQILLDNGKQVATLDRELLELQILPLILEREQTIESENEGRLLYEILYELDYNISLDQQTQIARVSIKAISELSVKDLSNSQKSLAYLLTRILGNCCALNFPYAVEEITKNINSVIESFNNLSSKQELALVKEFLWFLGNFICQINSKEIFQIIENGLQIPNIFL